MNYLLDTCVLSELTRTNPNVKVVEWLRAQDPLTLFISYLTIGEIRKGIVKRNGDIRARRLERWLMNTIFNGYQDRIIPVAKDEALTWGNVCGEAEHTGKKRPAIDSLIAATALAHQMTLVTRNVDDMAGTGVPIFNPFEE